MSNNPEFYIYSASAGSGKTYTLAKEYLRLCLSFKDARRFREILAITFTNKAAAEMKQRILRNLEDLSKGELDDALLNTLLNETGLPFDKLVYRAQAVHRQILHNYADFSISTIDHFTHRLVRTFAADLRLSPTFDVELDQDRLLTEATDLLISKAGTNKELTQVLSKYIDERLDEERNWNLESAVKDTANHIYKERSRTYVKELQKLPLGEFLEIKKRLQEKYNGLKNKMQELANVSFDAIDNLQIDHKAFPGSSKLTHFLGYVRDWNLAKLLPHEKITVNIEAGIWTTGTKKEYESAILEISHLLTTNFFQLKAMAEEYIPFFALTQAVLKEFYSMAVLEQVNECLEELKEAENIIPISEFNPMIFEKLKDEPASYIYERLGERYRYFFIDEFQDTSVMQWQNILPLINNAMATGGYCMLVGDAKQSIYRWRGGEAEQFIDLYLDKDPSNKYKTNGIEREIYKRQTIPLEFNWRSREEIVNFNNSFFVNNANSLRSPSYQSLYRESAQKVKGKTGGYVEFKILSKETEEFKEQNLHRITLEINRAQSHGYFLKDICILVRGKKSGQLIIEKLTEQGISCYSADSLFVANAKEVKLVLAILKWNENKQSKEIKLELLTQLLLNTTISIDPANWHDFIKERLELSEEEFLKFIKQELSDVWHALRHEFFLYDLCERLFESTKTFVTSNSFVSSFLNKVHEYCLRNQPVVSGFLHWWSEYGEKVFVEPPEEDNAIAIMTIHKSKGLEFPVVILPFCDWDIEKEQNPQRWYDLPEDLEIDFALIPVSKTNSEIIGGAYQNFYEDYLNKVKFDNLNLLYVAMTRARDVLCVYSREYKKGRTYDFFKHFLTQNDLLLDEANTLSIGEYPHSEKKEIETATHDHNIVSNAWEIKVEIASSYPQNWPEGEDSATSWGNKVHQILSEVYSFNDIPTVLRNMEQRGVISLDNKEALEQQLNTIVSHPKLRTFFTGRAKIFNEREIIIPGMEFKRPDRLVNLNNEWIIIDYKTGKEQKAHVHQINKYGELIEQCFTQKPLKILVYINQSVEVKEWY